MLRLILWLSFVSLLSLLTSCVGVPLPNEPICAEINPGKGGCTKIISGEQFIIDEEHPYKFEVIENGKTKIMSMTWWEMKPYMIQLPYPAWVSLKQFIIKVCKKHEKTCQKEVSSWDRTVEGIDTNVKKRLPKKASSKP